MDLHTIREPIPNRRRKKLIGTVENGIPQELLKCWVRIVWSPLLGDGAGDLRGDPHIDPSDVINSPEYGIQSTVYLLLIENWSTEVSTVETNELDIGSG